MSAPVGTAASLTDAAGSSVTPAPRSTRVTVAVADAVTALFVPGDRPERFGKAARSGADLVIVDLEDALAPAARPAALRAVVAALEGGVDGADFAAVVRLSATPPPGEVAADELAALLDAEAARPRSAAVGGSSAMAGLLGVMLPKAESPEAVRAVVQRLPQGVACIPLIETAAGVLAAVELARIPGVTRLGFGAVDFAVDVDLEGDGGPVLGHARAQLVLASRAAGIAAPLDSPSLEISETAPVEAAARAARASGFGGKLCIHPAQLEAVRSAFRPSAEQVAEARRVVAADLEAEGGAVQLDGRMIDRPVVDRARRILARSADDPAGPAAPAPASATNGEVA